MRRTLEKKIVLHFPERNTIRATVPLGRAMAVPIGHARLKRAKEQLEKLGLCFVRRPVMGDNCIIISKVRQAYRPICYTGNYEYVARSRRKLKIKRTRKNKVDDMNIFTI